MAYMSTEQAAKIRAELKAAFPLKDGWKFSVSKCAGSLGIDVYIMAAPHEFACWDFDHYTTDETAPRTASEAKARNMRKGTDQAQVNHYYIAESWVPESAAILQKVSDIIHRDHWDKSDSQSDYFHCAFYVHMGIGQWGNPCKNTKVKESADA